MFLITRLGDRSDPFPFFVTTYPEDWTRTYVDRNFFEVDPVIKLAHSALLPVDWSSFDRTSPRSAAFFSEADSSKVGRHGLTSVVRGPRGERSLFLVTSDLPDSRWSKLRASYGYDFQVMSHYFHDRTLLLSGLRISPPQKPLSPREAQCLQHLASGFIPKQIAPQLGISEAAVRLYLRSARRKLGATTLGQAVARASYQERIFF